MWTLFSRNGRAFAALAVAATMLAGRIVPVAATYPFTSCLDDTAGRSALVNFHRVDVHHDRDNNTFTFTAHGQATAPLPNSTHALFKASLLILPLHTESLNKTCDTTPGLCRGTNFTITRQFTPDISVPLMELGLGLTLLNEKEAEIGCVVSKVETYSPGYRWLLRVMPPLLLVFLAVSTVVAYVFASGRFSLFRFSSGWRPRDAANDAGAPTKREATLPAPVAVGGQRDDTPSSTTALTRSAPGFVDGVLFCQAIAASGQLHVVYPLFYKTFTTLGFGWSTLAIPLPFLLDLIRSMYRGDDPAVLTIPGAIMSPVDYSQGDISSWQVTDQLRWLAQNSLGLPQYGAYLGILPHELFPVALTYVLFGLVMVGLYTVGVMVATGMVRRRCEQLRSTHRRKIFYYGLGCGVRWLLLSSYALLTYGFLSLVLGTTATLIACAAVGLALLTVLPIGFLLFRLFFRGNTNAVDALHDPTRLLLYGPLINALKETTLTHAYVDIIYRWLSAILVGIGAVSPAVQTISLAVLELIMFALLIVRRPYLARNDLQLLFSFTRLVTFGSTVVFLLKTDLLRVPAAYFAILLQSICLLLCFIAGLRRILATTWRRGRRLVGLPEKPSTSRVQPGPTTHSTAPPATAATAPAPTYARTSAATSASSVAANQAAVATAAVVAMPVAIVATAATIEVAKEVTAEPAAKEGDAPPTSAVAETAAASADSTTITEPPSTASDESQPEQAAEPTDYQCTVM